MEISDLTAEQLMFIWECWDKTFEEMAHDYIEGNISSEEMFRMFIRLVVTRELQNSVSSA